MTNKRMLKQQYLEDKSRAGVYAITNLTSGRVLVGGSMDVQGALNRHRFELRQGTHRNKLLSEEWALYGETNFRFEVLDVVKPTDDASFDVASELNDLVSMWSQEILAGKDDCEFSGKAL
jgi:hypothetical protein